MKTMKAVLMVLAVSASIVVLGQVPKGSGSITGTVRDTSGNTIPGVTVTAAGPGSRTTVQTNENGVYTMANLAPETSYSVTASLPGFFLQVATGIVVSNGAPVRQDFTLRIQAPQNPPYQNRNPNIRADQQTQQGTIVQYRGHVRMTTDTLEVNADELDFNVAAGSGDVRGNVTVRVLPPTARYIPLAH